MDAPPRVVSLMFVQALRREFEPQIRQALFPPRYLSASAPPTMSINSFVMASWRVLL